MEAKMSKRILLLLAFPAVTALAGDGPASKETGVSVSLCDGQSSITLAGLKPGEALARPEAQKAAGQMLQVWRETQGETRWASWAAEAAKAPFPRGEAAAPQAQAGGEAQPTKFSARDQMLWKREEKKWIDEGYKAFHNAKALGGTIGISCDMCHPDGTNTHPETYPKYQVQIKKTVLLRDMINWCIENPLKGKPLPEGDETLRAVEAYIFSTRKGVALEPGKH
jgi:hypothetical protein